MSKSAHLKMGPSSAVEYFKALLEQQTRQDEDNGNNATIAAADNVTSGADDLDLDLLKDPIDLLDFKHLLFNFSSDVNNSDSSVFNLDSLDSYHHHDLRLDDDDLDGDLVLPPFSDIRDLIDKFKINLDKINPISDAQFWTLSLVYSFFVIFGFFGNVLILWAVLGRESMRTARNVFIVTLAISDMVLCLFTMPFKLWEVLYRRWPFGPDTQWLCQLANAGQTTPVFMSSLSIVAIALDRYRCILQPDLRQISVPSSIFASGVMASLSLLMSIPLFTGTQLMPYVSFNRTTMKDILVCSDDRSGSVRTAYRLSSTFVQFLLPLLLVLAVYLSILVRLRHRPQSRHSSNNRRRRRTNVMIILISVTFFLSWLPLNVLNTILDFSPDFIETHLDGQDRLVYGICNILGLGNACVNPVLYGYLNENFRKEYTCIYRRIPWHRVSSARRSSSSNNNFMGDNNNPMMQYEMSSRANNNHNRLNESSQLLGGSRINQLGGGDTASLATNGGGGSRISQLSEVGKELDRKKVTAKVTSNGVGGWPPALPDNGESLQNHGEGVIGRMVSAATRFKVLSRICGSEEDGNGDGGNGEEMQQQQQHTIEEEKISAGNSHKRFTTTRNGILKNIADSEKRQQHCFLCNGKDEAHERNEDEDEGGGGGGGGGSCSGSSNSGNSSSGCSCSSGSGSSNNSGEEEMGRKHFHRKDEDGGRGQESSISNQAVRFQREDGKEEEEEEEEEDEHVRDNSTAAAKAKMTSLSKDDSSDAAVAAADAELSSPAKCRRGRKAADAKLVKVKMSCIPKYNSVMRTTDF